MKKALLIAEKPSLAEAIEEGYKSYKHKEYDITYCACAGHLMELCMPNEYSEEWSKWNLDVLPMIPQTFKSKVTKAGSKRYNIIKKELQSGKYDVVISAGDPAREGELIIDEILRNLNCKIPELRLWVEDLTVNGICKAFDNLLPPQNNLKKAAYLRAWNDWLIGMNGSRAITLSTGSKISVGRVMSVVNAMVAKRDIERENFKPVPYYECVVHITSGDEEFEGMLLKDHNSIKFENQDEIQTLINSASVEGKVVSVTNENRTTKPPLLLNLAELQKEAFSEYGYSPDKVLKIAQSLYEKKLLSYPRTDCRYISDNVARELDQNLKALSQIPEYSKEISRILADKDTLNKICKQKNKYVDDSKLTDHHALITTNLPAQFTDLSDDEQNIYKLVSRRVVALFMPDKIVSKSKIICQFGGINTLSEGRSIIQAGYTEIIPVSSKEKTLPNLDEDDDVSISGLEGLKKSTKPPQFYNFKTLLDDMENCGKFAENKDNAKMLKDVAGIGQSSTRDSIIKKVISLNYIKEVGKGKKSHLESTESGRYIYEILKDTELVSVDSTALMESKLVKVEKGEYDANTYYGEMIADIKRITEELKNLQLDSNTNPLKASNKPKSVQTDIICPKCGKVINESAKAFYCSGWRDKSCDFSIPKTINGVSFTQKEFKFMIAGNKLNRRFKWKSGKKGDAMIGIENNRYKFYFK